jgi:hypothetical protein
MNLNYKDYMLKLIPSIYAFNKSKIMFKTWEEKILNITLYWANLIPSSRKCKIKLGKMLRISKNKLKISL